VCSLYDKFVSKKPWKCGSRRNICMHLCKRWYMAWYSWRTDARGSLCLVWPYRTNTAHEQYITSKIGKRIDYLIPLLYTIIIILVWQV